MNLLELDEVLNKAKSIITDQEDFDRILLEMREERRKEDFSILIGLCPECGTNIESDISLHKTGIIYWTCDNNHIFIRAKGID